MPMRKGMSLLALFVVFGLASACVPFPAGGSTVVVVTATPMPATPTERIVVVTATSAATQTPAATSTERVPVTTPTAPASGVDPISDAVMARDTQGDTFDPVGVTSTFPSAQSIFHTVITIKDAPDQTRVLVVWKVIDDGNASDANTEMARYELSSQGSRNLDFSFKPNAGQLPAGSYKAEIYLNGKLEGTLSFAVSAQSSTSVIADAVMAKDVQGANFEPVTVTNTFDANQSIFHAVVTLKDAPTGTKVRAAWFIVAISDPTQANKNIGEYEETTDGSRNIDFTFKPNAGHLPPGKYRVEIYLNGNLDRTLNFEVLGTG